MGKYIFISVKREQYYLMHSFCYSRGPNKYTRNWEDEDAYGKPGTNITNRNKKFNRSGEDFPVLGTNKNAPVQVDEPVISSAWYSSKNKIQNKVQNFPPLQAQSDSPKTKSSSTSNAQTCVIFFQNNGVIIISCSLKRLT